MIDMFYSHLCHLLRGSATNQRAFLPLTLKWNVHFNEQINSTFASVRPIVVYFVVLFNDKKTFSTEFFDHKLNWNEDNEAYYHQKMCCFYQTCR